MVRLRCLPLLASVLFLAFGNADAHAQAALPGFQVTACSTGAEGLSKLDAFERNLRKFHVDLFAHAFVSENDVQGHLGEADMWAKQNTARMIEEASAALASVSDARSKLDAVGLDFDAMKRSSQFTKNRGVASLIDAALGQIDGGISKLYQAQDSWEQAAKAFLAYDYGAAESQMENGALTWGSGVMAIQAGELAVTGALAALRDSSACEQAADVAPAMSATQISRATGGAGTQRRSGDAITVIVPKRLTLKKPGPTTLPITLQVSKPGLIELWLTRGQKLIINIYAGTAKTGKFGLRLKVPNARGKPKLTLRLAFVSGTVDPTQTITLTIRSA